MESPAPSFLLSLPFLAGLVLVTCLVEAHAWTYQDSSWWFGPDTDIVGNVGISYSYPDWIYRGDTLEVGVTLEYIKNENAKSNYVLFSNIFVHVNDANRTISFVSTGGNVTSGIIRPGDNYSYLFKIPTSDLPAVESEYAVDLSFSALFSRSTSLDEHEWYSADYYHRGNIGSHQLPNIIVFERNVTDSAGGETRTESSNIDNRQLTIGIMRPYTFIHPVTINVDGSPYSLTQDNRFWFLLPENTDHEVSVPETIELLDGIRAVFVKWVDGSTSTKRNVTLDTNKEMSAIYKTQYYLNLSSQFGTPEGKGWHDSGSNAAFSVDQFSGASSFHGFDRWAGDFSSSEPFGTILMDGPKTLNATWKFESSILAGIVGTIAALISLIKLLPPAVNHFRKSHRDKMT